MQSLLSAYHGKQLVQETDVYDRARALVSYQTQTQSSDDWSNIVNVSFDPGDFHPDGEASFTADPLDWLDYWHPITETLYRWEMWYAEASEDNKAALDQAVQDADLSDSVSSYLASPPDDFDNWPSYYQRLLDLI
ncbi:hypothetical protein [Deinococcus sp. RM]|uniref:hypothetical protein n=1 Tax=Deinococcus sp. RM TaxID=2316359 RepID=UPI0011C21CE5|nr:hypothetical protein [Deinococcus sp. RM]